MNKFSIAFIDMLYCFLTVTLVVLALFAAKFSEESVKSKGNIIDPSDFLIEMSWEGYSQTDMDLWVSNPEGIIVYYGARDIGGMTLDRDDLGHRGDERVRREVVSVRRIIPGTYRVGAVKYNDNGKEDNKVQIIVRKLNPYFELDEKVVLFPSNPEKVFKPYVEFDVDKDGNVISVRKNTEFNLREELVLSE